MSNLDLMLMIVSVLLLYFGIKAAFATYQHHLDMKLARTKAELGNSTNSFLFKLMNDANQKIGGDDE